MNKKLASIAAVALALATVACQQTPPPQAPPPGPPPGAAPGPPGPGEPGPGHAFGPGGPHGPGPGFGEHEGRPERHADRDERWGRGMRGDERARGGEGKAHMGPGPEGMGHGPGPDVMRELAALGVHFYPPPMLIRRGPEIGLTPDQIAKIRQEILTVQTRSVELKSKVERAKIETIRLLSADKVDEKAVGAQIDEATKAGAELHKLHIGMMLRVRGLLTPEQVKKLEERKHRPKDAKPGMGPGRHAQGDADDDDDD